MQKLWTRLMAAGAVMAVVGAGSVVAATGSGAATGTPVAMPTPGGSEPGINLGPDGSLYINAPDGLLSNIPGSPSFVWKLAPGATSWVLTPPGLRANLPGGGDANLAIDPGTGDLFLTDLWLGSATISVSTDKAATWTPNPLGGVPVEDRQWIATGGSGPNGPIVYEATHQIPSGLVVTKSIDGGHTFPIASVAATPVDQTGCICPPGNLIASAGSGLLGTSDKVGLIYATSTGGVNFAQSTNGGATFTTETVAPASSDTTSNNFPVVADGGNGTLYATWLDQGGSSSVVKMSIGSNWGTTWSTPQTIVSSGTSVYPWISARTSATGTKVAVSLYHTTSTFPTPDAATAGTQWFESFVESTDGGTTWTSPTVADSTVAKTGAVCTGGTNCTADRELGDFQTDLVDPAGNVDMSYVRVPSPGSSTVYFVQGS